MKISYNWLKQYLDFDQSPYEVAEILTLTGLEVEEVTQIGSTLEGVVVGKVLTCEKHPNADKLSLCTVDTGTEVVQIVCGAPNVAAGQTVAVATVGTELPLALPDGSNLVIKKSKIRGEVSEGMICAEDELGIGEDHSGIMVLSDSFKLGTPISKVIDTRVDYVFEIGLTPNRPDASCHLGVARDMAAVLNKNLKKPFSSLKSHTESSVDDAITVEIKNPELCHRYVGMMVRNVKVQPSPEWLQARLRAIGLRPINAIVDATNFVLHELGQPLHAFDFDLLKSKRIVIQSFSEQKEFVTLDDQKRSIPAGSLFICDGDEPVALAGIMGGGNSEINDHTTSVFLESAYFEPVGIRKTSKAVGLQTDSSYRFERGIDPNITYAAAKRCAELIAELTGGTLESGYLDVHPIVTEPKSVTLRLSRLNKILGMEFTANQVVSILKSLEFEVKKNGGDDITCTVPTFRPDVSAEIDLIEEVARIYDYNKIPNPEYIKFSRPETLSFTEQFQNRVRNLMVSLGYREIYANSLLAEKEASIFAEEAELIHTLNPISKDTAVMRPSLVPGFIRAAAFNFNRESKRVQFFEIGNVFKRSDKGTYHKGISEETHILFGCGGEATSASWNRNAISFSVFDIKGSLDRLLEDLRIAHLVTVESNDDTRLVYKNGSTVLGEVLVLPGNQKKLFDTNESLFCAEFSLTKLQGLVEALDALTYTPIPKFPGIEYDFALIVDQSVAAGDMIHVIRQYGTKKLNHIHVFDLFEGKALGEGKKSIAFRLNFVDDSKTLTIKDVDSIIGKIVNRLEQQFGAKLRS
jgi:phenylalanyl-tRNA synthetase beta chain